MITPESPNPAHDNSTLKAGSLLFLWGVQEIFYPSVYIYVHMCIRLQVSHPLGTNCLEKVDVSQAMSCNHISCLHQSHHTTPHHINSDLLTSKAGVSLTTGSPLRQASRPSNLKSITHAHIITPPPCPGVKRDTTSTTRF